MRIAELAIKPFKNNASLVWLASALAISIYAFPEQSIAQDKKEIRELAKTLEARLRAQGEPRDRCSLGANIYDGPVVARTTAGSSLQPGDRLALLNGGSVTGKSADDVIAMLRDLPPTAVVALTIDRGGELVDIEAQCVNARTFNEPLIEALNLAAKGRFDACLDALDKIPDPDTRTVTVKAQCASVASKSKRGNATELVTQLLEMGIEDARYAHTLRPDIVQALRRSQGQITQALGADRYKALVAATKRWPGGERLFDESSPDWGLFRRNSEAALRSRLIDPDSARIEWTHGFQFGSWKPFLSKQIDGYWSCGLINAKNRMGGYTGSSAFVVVLDPTGYIKYSEIGESKDFDLLATSCSNSLQYLPPPPPELLSTLSQGEPPGSSSPSLADELQKLVDLRNSGALTEEEFQAAKQKLLGSPAQ